jgi:hypothetical protein
LDEKSRVVRMTKRRPPLPPDLQDAALQIAKEVRKTEAQKARELAEAIQQADFESMRNEFLNAHEEAIVRGLQSVFGEAELHKAPLNKAVQARFMKAFLELPSGCELRPAFHGTNSANHGSIFKRGLLIPGDENELKVIHGAAHGRGVYTANVDAAWLSQGFITGDPVMLICGVLQTDCVRHVGDAMVVGKSEHVVPFYCGKQAKAVVKDLSKSAVVSLSTSKASKQSPSKAAQTETPPVVGKGGAKVVAKTEAGTRSKFLAKLAKRSNRH